MFNGCSSLTSLDLSNFNTSNVTGMGNMFNDCRSLTSLDLSNFNTENVSEMGNMFTKCSSLTSLDLSNFNTSNVTDMSDMFNGCSSLKSLDLSNFNTENVSEMGNLGNMFNGCTSLQTLNLGPDFVISDLPSTITTNMFKNCSSLYKIIIGKDRESFATQLIGILKASGLDKEWTYNSKEGYVSIDPYTNTTTDITLSFPEYYTYNETTGLATILIDKIITDGILKSCESSFSGKSGLKQITNITSLDTRHVTTMAGMFNGCSSLGLPI